MDRSISRQAAATLIFAALALLSGCNIVAPIGGMIESYKRESTQTIAPKCMSLNGKSFAVVVGADRIVQADYPSLVGDITITAARRLSDEAHDVGGTGFVPGEDVLQFQYTNPRWVAMTMPELGKQLGVQRLVFVDLTEFRLNDPGNQYLWAGVASGSVQVFEMDGPSPSIPVFRESIRVKFPDKDGLGPMQVPAQGVQVTLTKRFVDRVTWLFYTHEEPYYPDY